jgi:hypothetical protein
MNKEEKKQFIIGLKIKLTEFIESSTETDVLNSFLIYIFKMLNRQDMEAKHEALNVIIEFFQQRNSENTTKLRQFYASRGIRYNPVDLVLSELNYLHTLQDKFLKQVQDTNSAAAGANFRRKLTYVEESDIEDTNAGIVKFIEIEPAEVNRMIKFLELYLQEAQLSSAQPPATSSSSSVLQAGSSATTSTSADLHDNSDDSDTHKHKRRRKNND